MDLLTPGSGLIFWQLLIFAILLFVLAKFAWKPILNSLKEREKFIKDSLNSAKKAEEETKRLAEKHTKEAAEAAEKAKKLVEEQQKALKEGLGQLLSNMPGSENTGLGQANKEMEDVRKGVRYG